MSKPVDALARPFLKRIEALYEELGSEQGKYMAEAARIKDDIADVYAEAKDKGVAVKPLKGLVKWRQLERKQEAIAAKLEDDDGAIYARLVETLGPLGAAAAKAHEEKKKGNGKAPDDDDRDLRPRHLRQPGASAASAPRADEEHLAKIGRGKVPEPATTSSAR